MLTKRDEDASVIKSISSGALDYITKPFQIQELINRIAMTLQGTRSKIFVARSETASLETTQQCLHKLGYTVLAEKAANKVLTRINTEQPDVVIMDVSISASDNYSILHSMKSNPATANIPVILVSSKDHKEEIVKGLEHGGYDYLVEPITSDALHTLVLAALQYKTKSGK